MGLSRKILNHSYAAPENMNYTVQLNSMKDKDKFIKRIERVVRSSMEYRDYIAYLKEHVNMNQCAFFNNIENAQGSKVRIEIHHEPLTLYDIVKVVVNKYIQEAIPLNDFYIADEVMHLHYSNQVGLIPLSKSVHQVVHNSHDIFIPLHMVYGNYRQFLEDYNDYLSIDETDTLILDKIESKINESRKFNQEMANKLTPKYVYVDVEGFSLPRKIEIQGTAVA